MRIPILLYVVLIVASSNSLADSLYTYIDYPPSRIVIIRDTLTDKSTGYKYFLDTAQVIITAMDKKGKVIWRTDPWKDNKIETYRVKRPVIVYFKFDNNKWTGWKEVIWITYNNSQFGVVDKKTGEFTWYGQD